MRHHHMMTRVPGATLNRRHAVGALACMLPLASCRRTAALTKVNVAIIPRPTLASLYAAQETGLFQKAGLDVSIEQISRTEHITVLLAGGRIDVGFTHPNPAFINAVKEGSRVRIVAGRDIASTECGAAATIYGRRESFPGGLRDLRELKGKRISITSPTALQAFALDAALATAGLDQTQVTIVTLETSTAMGALSSGAIDALVSSTFDRSPESFSNEIIRSKGLADIHPGQQYSFMAYGRRFLDEDRETGIRFLGAFLAGTRAFAAGYTPRFFRDLAGKIGTDPKMLASACRSSLVPDGRIDSPSIERLVSWAARRRFTDGSVKPEQVVDRTFLEELGRRQPQEFHP